jgi:hypothetical protein
VALAHVAPPPAGEADLILLLRFMTLLKGAIALIIVRLLLQRFVRPLRVIERAGYAMGSASMAAGAVWLWFQWQLGWGILLFYAGITLIVLTAARDGSLLAVRRQSPTSAGHDSGQIHQPDG